MDQCCHSYSRLFPWSGRFSPRVYLASFHLADLGRHNLFIEHDASYSRDNYAVGNQIDFDPYIWNVSMTAFNYEIVTAFGMGIAKSRRVRESYLRHPQTIWGPRAIVNTGLEIGILLSSFTNWVIGSTRRSWLQVLFTEERLPYHLGWRPIPLASNGATIIGLGVAGLLADPTIIDSATRAILSTPSVSATISREEMR
jgi:hypothetical protein